MTLIIWPLYYTLTFRYMTSTELYIPTSPPLPIRIAEFVLKPPTETLRDTNLGYLYVHSGKFAAANEPKPELEAWYV